MWFWLKFCISDCNRGQLRWPEQKTITAQAFWLSGADIMERACVFAGDRAINCVDLPQRVMVNEGAETHVLQGEGGNMLLEQGVPLEGTQQKNEQDDSLDCTPKNHAKPEWKRLRRLSVEEALPAGLHVHAEREAQDGDGLAAVDEVKGNKSEASLCSDSASSQSPFVWDDSSNEIPPEVWELYEQLPEHQHSPGASNCDSTEAVCGDEAGFIFLRFQLLSGEFNDLSVASDSSLREVWKSLRKQWLFTSISPHDVKVLIFPGRFKVFVGKGEDLDPTMNIIIGELLNSDVYGHAQVPAHVTMILSKQSS